LKTFKIPPSAQQLMNTAKELTGIFHIVDLAIERPLEKLLESLNSETQLNAGGATAIEKRILRMLCNRLRMERDFLSHPEIGAQQILQPLFITGMGRTGSTKMQRMLAASGDFLYIPCWQSHSLSLRTGDRNESPSERIRDAEEEIHWFNTNAPNVERIHPFDAHVAEEESVALEHCLFAPWMAALLYVPSYAAWRVGLGFEDDLHYLKRILQYLQWQFHDGDERPWILKSPAYPGMEPLLAKVFPDAVFVTTHRHPVSVISSAASLLSSFHGAFSDYDPKAILGPLVLEQLAMGADRHIQGRDSDPTLNIVDVGYTELRDHATQTAAKVYSHADLILDDTAIARMAQWETENDQHKHGIHQYDMKAYALTPSMIESRFSVYINRFNNIF